MEYKIFYSYQSDIDKELNELFIEAALDEAVKQIKSCKLKIVKGFSGTSGNKPLAQTMFDQSRGCDIFVGDMTFTSSRNSHIEKDLFHFRGKQYFTRVEGNVKMSPNPNVLIETGYSWAQKDYDRTILVINDAFGNADLLPIDMRHLRWPLSYNLSTTKKEDPKNYDRIFLSFVASLKVAINAAVNTTQKYHRERFRPFRIYQDWKDPIFSNDYVPIDELKEIIQKLRIELSKPGSVQRILGPKSSGKTRLAFELYRKHDATLKRDETIEKVLFYDLDATSYSNIESPLQELAILNQDKVVVVDNCDLKTHNKITKDLYNSNVRLLTIDEFIEGVVNQATFQITTEIADKISEATLSKKFKGKNAISIIQATNGNLAEAIAYINSPITDDTDLTTDFDNKWRQLLGEVVFAKGGLAFLKAISIFNYIGITNGYKQQGEYVAKVLCNGMPYDDFLDLANQLSEKGLVKIKGDFITLENFIEELALSWWEDQSEEKISKLFVDAAAENMSRSLGARLIELTSSKSNQDLLKIISGGSGILDNYDFIDSDQGSKIIMSLSEVIPIQIAESLSKAFEGKSTTQLLKFEKGRRYVIWALERLAFRKETFSIAAKLLFRLALAENENISNNSTYQFVQLFQPILAGTEVDLIARFELLITLQDDTKEDVTKLILAACTRALMTSQYIRQGGAQSQAGIELEDYYPKQAEKLKYWELIINFLQSKLYE
jgi:hypothetical protein